MILARALIAWCLLTTLPVVWLVPLTVAEAQSTKKKKKKRVKRRAPRRKVVKPAAPVEAEVPASDETKIAPIEPSENERSVPAVSPELFQPKLSEPVVERKKSKLVSGVSRWSNVGAMEPIESEVELRAPIPERAVPKAAGQATPGQRLSGRSEEQFSAHLSFSMSHLETVRQDDLGPVYDAGREEQFENGVFDDRLVAGVPRSKLDTNLYRGRATFDYRQIAGSDFGAHFDLEYRAQSSGTRPTDRRLNALYLSYGLDHFYRLGGPNYGLAVGRLAIPEAGMAQADGIALRYRFSPAFRMGVFGGLSGNPYNFNWQLRQVQLFSANWITGGAFASFRKSRFFVEGSVVSTLARVDVGGLDRVYAFLDSGYVVSDQFNLFLTGYLDAIPSGRPVQSVELIGSWTPDRSTTVRISAGHYGTIVYRYSSLYSFAIDPRGNQVGNGGGLSGVVVDESGAPIAAYDGKFQAAIYNRARVYAGHRFDFGLEPYASVDLFLRDNQESAPELAFAPLRLTPTVGARYRNPKLLDAFIAATGIVDQRSNAKFTLSAGVSRQIFGFDTGLDARLIAGTISAADGGVFLNYTFPAEWMPGRLMLRSMFRYFREDVALDRPVATTVLAPDVTLPIVPLQESFYGFLGVDWRL